MKLFGEEMAIVEHATTGLELLQVQRRNAIERLKNNKLYQIQVA